MRSQVYKGGTGKAQEPVRRGLYRLRVTKHSSHTPRKKKQNRGGHSRKNKWIRETCERISMESSHHTLHQREGLGKRELGKK